MGDILIHCSHDKMVSVDDLKPHPRNPNKHPPKQIELLAKVIKHQGWRSPIVVSKLSGFVVVGHGRLDAAKHLGCETVPVNYQEFQSEAEELAHMVADNRLAELAEIDESELTALISELSEMDFDIDLAGFENAIRDLPELKTRIQSIDDRFQPSVQCQRRKGASVTVIGFTLEFEQAARWKEKKTELGIEDDKKAFLELI